MLKKLLFLLLLEFIFLLQSATTGASYSIEASTKRIPWSGYWWSMEQGELVLGWVDGMGRKRWSENEVRAFDKCLSEYSPSCSQLIEKMAGKNGEALSPLMKFDYYVRLANEKAYRDGKVKKTDYSHAALWELDNHYIGTNTSHRYWDDRGYAGKCIGWALATTEYDEPTKVKTLGGVIFRPADIKGVLSSIYNGAQFFIPDENFVGNQYRDRDPQDHYDDVSPHQFIKALQQTVHKNKILEADLEPGPEVWNYPIFRYKLRGNKISTNEVTGTVEIFYADDEVAIDEVFSNNKPRKDIKSRTLNFSLKVDASWNGDFAKALSSQWSGDSIAQHPDSLITGIEDGWRSSIYEYRNTDAASEINYPLLKRVRMSGTKWTPLIDVILNQYYR